MSGLDTSDPIAVCSFACRRSFFLLIALAAAWVLWHTRDRNRGYTVQLNLRPPTASPPSTLRVGFGREKITPDLTRPVWLAGFANGRKAIGRARRPLGGGGGH